MVALLILAHSCLVRIHFIAPFDLRRNDRFFDGGSSRVPSPLLPPLDSALTWAMSLPLRLMPLAS